VLYELCFARSDSQGGRRDREANEGESFATMDLHASSTARRSRSMYSLRSASFPWSASALQFRRSLPIGRSSVSDSTPIIVITSGSDRGSTVPTIRANRRQPTSASISPESTDEATRTTSVAADPLVVFIEISFSVRQPVRSLGFGKRESRNSPHRPH